MSIYAVELIMGWMPFWGIYRCHRVSKRAESHCNYECDMCAKIDKFNEEEHASCEYSEVFNCSPDNKFTAMLYIQEIKQLRDQLNDILEGRHVPSSADKNQRSLTEFPDV